MVRTFTSWSSFNLSWRQLDAVDITSWRIAAKSLPDLVTKVLGVVLNVGKLASTSVDGDLDSRLSPAPTGKGSSFISWKEAITWDLTKRSGRVIQFFWASFCKASNCPKISATKAVNLSLVEFWHQILENPWAWRFSFFFTLRTSYELFPVLSHHRQIFQHSFH